MKAENGDECNLADTSFRNGGPGLKGDKNGMFGKTHTPEAREKIRQANLEWSKNHPNTQAGISPKDRMDAKTYKSWKAKQRARKDGGTNPNVHLAVMINVHTKEYKVFDTIVHCTEFMSTLPEFDRYDSLEKDAMS